MEACQKIATYQTDIQDPKALGIRDDSSIFPVRNQGLHKLLLVQKPAIILIFTAANDCLYQIG